MEEVSGKGTRNSMELIADLHVHTVASGHAYSTIQENVAEAVKKGLKIFGLSDHGPCVAGAPSFHYFRSLRFVPRYIDGVLILRGAEANIVSNSGKIDIPEHCLENLDYTMVGFHAVEEYPPCKDVAANTKAMIAAMDNPYIKVITHPGNPKYPLDYDAIVQAAKEKGVAIEINNSSLVSSREGGEQNCRHIATLIAKYDALTVIGSDAHISFDVGRFTEALQAVHDAGIKEENIINADRDRLFDFLDLDIKE